MGLRLGGLLLFVEAVVTVGLAEGRRELAWEGVGGFLGVDVVDMPLAAQS